MIDSFEISSSYQSIKADRDNIQEEYYQESNNSNDSLILRQLPIHLIEFRNEVTRMKNPQNTNKDEKFNPHALNSSLKSIETTLDEIQFFPYQKFVAFNILENLFEIVNLNQRDEDIFRALYIIGHYYCHDLKGSQLIKSSPFVNLFLEWMGIEKCAPFLPPILDGIAGLLKFDNSEEENSLTRFLLLNHFDEQIINIYEKSTENVIFIAMIIKNLMKNKDQEFLYSTQKFLPMLNTFITSKVYQLTRLSIQSARHLIYNFPATLDQLKENGFFGNLINLLLCQNPSFGELKSAYHFLGVCCQRNSELAKIVLTNELMNLACPILVQNGSNVREVKNILYDIESIMLADKSLIYPIIDSNMLSYLFKNAHEGSFFISIQCTAILCDIINSNNIEAIQKVIDENFLDLLQQILSLTEDPRILSLGLDTIITLFEVGQTDNNDIIQKLREQEWLPDSINDILCDTDIKDDILYQAKHVNECIIRNVFQE